jgi:hypothetical protein
LTGKAGQGQVLFFCQIDPPGTFFCGFAAKKPGQENAREARAVFHGLTARRGKNRMS